MTSTPLDPSTPQEHAAKDMSAALSGWRMMVFDLPLRLTSETLRFTSRRLAAQAEHLSALSRCTSLTDAVNLQTAFVKQAVSAYEEETATLSHDVQDAITVRAA